MPSVESNTLELQRLWVYGLLRSLNAPVADAARIVEASLSDDTVLEGYVEMLVQAGSNRVTHSQLAAGGQHPGTAISMAVVQETLQTVVENVASSVPIVSIVFSAAKWLTKLFTYVQDRRRPSGCGKVCEGNKSYDRRAIIGVHPPPGRRNTRGNITLRMGDGIIWEGPKATRPAYLVGTAPGPDVWPTPFFGSLGGVVAPRYSYHATGTTWRRLKSQESARADLIKYGRLPASVGLGRKDSPWLSPGNNYCYREWVAARLMGWFQGATSCSALICANSTLTLIGNSYYDPACKCTGEKVQGNIRVPTNCTSACDDGRGKDAWMYQVGSVWYASLWFMHADFTALVQYLKIPKAKQVLSGLGYDDAVKALDEYRWTRETPFKFFSVSKTLNLEQLQTAIKKLSLWLPADMRLHLTAPTTNATILAPEQAAVFQAMSTRYSTTPVGTASGVTTVSSGGTNKALAVAAVLGVGGLLVYAMTRR